MELAGYPGALLFLDAKYLAKEPSSNLVFMLYLLGAWVTTIIKMLVSVRGDVRKREKVRFRPRKGVAISLNG